MSLISAIHTTIVKAAFGKGTSGRIASRQELQKSHILENGTGAGQADLEYAFTLSVTTSGSTIDLTGSLTNYDGTNFNCVEITDIYIEKDDEDAGYLIIGGGSNPLAGVTGFAEPFFHMACDSGIPVTAGTGDLLKIASSAGTITVNGVIHGRSA